MIAGVDEAGRGALAGPVVAASVILPKSFPLNVVKDSKMLSQKQRESIYEIIKDKCVYIGVGMVGPKKVTEVNILNATMIAMKKAVLRLGIKPSEVLVDGNKVPIIPGYNLNYIIKGDRLVPAISAASIVAKVVRDWYMEKWDVRFPQYGFSSHKGYGTRRHYDRLLENGPCSLHRAGFKLYRSEPVD